MQHPTERTAPSWFIDAERLDLRLEEIALLTGKSYSAVYRYKTGTRPTPPDWLAQVRLLIRSRELRRELPREGDVA